MGEWDKVRHDAGCGGPASWAMGPLPDGRVPIPAAAEMPPVALSVASTAVNRTGAWADLRPLYRERPAPCQVACPAHLDVARWMRAAQRGRHEEAWRILMEGNPLPAVTGRICYRPCEEACNRGRFDQAVAIREVERFLGDLARAEGWRVAPEAKPKRERAAVIGSGPAGLSCAYRLALEGYPVTIFEALPRSGGILRVGIPGYRLPHEVLDGEVRRLRSLGVEIRTLTRVGHDLPWEALSAYQAIYVAVGCGRARALAIEGMDLRGVVAGLEFLQNVNLGRPMPIGRCVAVIGGGNVAIDVARSARRLGAEEVTLVALEAEEELPAHPEEIAAAQAEGIRLLCRRAAVGIEGADGVARRVRTAAARFLGRTPAGEVRFEVVPGSESLLEAGTVICAIGQAPDLSFLPEGLSDGGRLVVGPSGQLGATGIFAGGDAVTGPARAIDAMAAGMAAGRAMARFLAGETVAAPAGLDDPVPFDDLNLAYFRPERRTLPRELPLGERLHGFLEISGTFGPAEAAREAARCFNCGACTGCDNCYLFCPDVSIAKLPGPDRYRVLEAYCKGCGICARECPRHVIAMVPANGGGAR